MERAQERIVQFVAEHSKIEKERIEKLMLDTSQLVKDVGTILCGKEAVKWKGLIDEVGGIDAAVKKLHELIEKNNK